MKSTKKNICTVAIVVLLFALCIGFLTKPAAAVKVSQNEYQLTSYHLVAEYSNQNYGSAYCSSTDQITVEVTGSGGWWGMDAEENTLTFRNDNIIPMKLTYTLVYTEMNGGKCSVEEGTYVVELSAKGEHKIVVESSATSAITKVTISDISLYTDAAAVIFYPMDAAMGQYSVNSQAISEPTVVEYISTTTVALPAVDGYEFVAWMICDESGNMTGEAYSSAEKFAPGVDVAVKPLYVPIGSARYQVDGVVYYTWEHAMQAGKNTGATVVVSKSGTLPNAVVGNVLGEYVTNAGTDAEPNLVYKVPAGVNLLLPYGREDSGSFGAKPTNYVSQTWSYDVLQNGDIHDRNYAFTTLTVSDGARIDCYGSINVNSKRQEDGQSFTGVPVGGYGKLILGAEHTGAPETDESKLQTQLVIKNGGKLYAYGFITGTGLVEVEGGVDANGNPVGGTVHELLQLASWPGGSNASDWNGLTKTNQDWLFLTSEYYVQNIETPLKLHYGATMYVEAVMELRIVGATTNSVPFITTNKATNPGLFVLSEAESYVLRVYDVAADRMNYYLKGGDAALGSLSISVSSMATVNSENYVLPITHNLSLFVEDGVTVTASKRVALLPGAELIVREGGTLNLQNRLYLFDVKDYTSSHFFHRASNMTVAANNTTPNHCPVPYVATLDGLSPWANDMFAGVIQGTSQSINSYYIDINNIHVSAKLQVDGLLNITGNGAVSTTNGGSSEGKLIAGSGEIRNNGVPAGMDLKVGYNSTVSTVTTSYGLLNLIDGGAMSTLQGTGPYFGFYYDVDGGPKYWWSTNTQIKLNIVDENGEVVASGKVSLFDGIEKTECYTDAACTTHADVNFTGSELYTKATAKIGDTYYQYITIAIENAKSGDRVVLLADIQLADGITIPANKNLTLDLNNHSITSETGVIVNYGTLDIIGGETGEGKTPGKLIAKGEGTAIANYGTIGTIGGNLLISAPSGDGIRVHKGKIGTIGGSGSDVKIEVRDYMLVVAAVAEVTTIGGTDGKVTFVQNNQGGTIQYPFYVSGTIGTIGGTNANVTIQQIHSLQAFSATIFVAGGRINAVGGDNATVNIIQDTQVTPTNDFRIAIWMNGGSIGTLGSGGTVNVISNYTAIYFGGSKDSDTYIETIGSAGTVNITGPTVAGKETPCKIGIYLNTNKHEHDIGVLGAGGTVNINANSYGVFVAQINSDIDKIATAGTVNITSASKGIYLAANGAKINTVGFGGNLVVKAKDQAIHVYGGSHIGRIGGENANVTILQDDGNTAVYVESGGTIGTIGATGTGLVDIDSNGIGIRVSGSGSRIEAIGGTGGKVDIDTANTAVEVLSSGRIDLIGGTGADVDITLTAEIATIRKTIYVTGGGWIDQIGGTNANIDIELSNTHGTSMAIWVYNTGTINKLGFAGNVNITSNKIGIYNGDDSGLVATITSIGDGGNVTIDADTGMYIASTGVGTIAANGGKVTIYASIRAIYLTSKGKIGTIGGNNGNVVIDSDVHGIVLESATATIETIGASGAEVFIDAGVRGVVLVTSGSQIGTFAAGGKVTINSVGTALYISSGTTVETLGGANGKVYITQTTDTSAGSEHDQAVVYVAGTLNTIGAGNSRVEIVQDFKIETYAGHAKLIYVNGGTITSIGTAAGATVLMNQTVVPYTTNGNSHTGWGLDVRNGGTVHAIGSANSLVEIIGYGSPVYTDGASSNIKLVTGNTMMVAKVRFGGNVAMWMVNPINTITGGFFADAGSDNAVNNVFNAASQEAIKNSPYAISDHTVVRVSEITGETYHCFYVYTDHEHAYDTSTPVYTWEVRNGVVTLVSTIHCDTAGCMHDKVETAVATTSYSITGDTCEVTYTATLNGHTDSYSETMELAGSISMYYDDRLSGDISILDKGTPVSKKVGTNELDDAVVSFGNGKLIATGIGTALVYKDGYLYQVKVSPAPISLFMITGHSVGMGSKGDPGQSIKCEEGQVYSYNVTNHSTNGYDSSRLMDSVTGTMGLGWASAERPLNVDALTTGGGLQGEDSGLAWYWNQLTGEKVYVVNAAVGGTSLHQWVVDDNYTGTSPSKNPQYLRTNAIKQFTQAQQIIANEVAAGHFTLEDMVLLYHGSANGGYRGFDYTYENGPAMYDIFFDAMRTALNRDVDGDGDRDEIKIGFVPIWTRSKDHSVTSGTPNFYMETASALLMAASGNYSDIFLASLIGWDKWLTDEKVQEYFKDYEQKFTTQNGTTLDVPQSNLALYPYEKGDYVHYAQFAYNEMGADIARNIYKLLRDKSNANVSLRLFKTDGLTEVAAGGAETLVMQFGDRLTLVPVVDPISINDLTFEVSGSLGMKHPLTIYPIGSGVGTLKIYYQDTLLKTITIDMGEATAVAQIGDTLYYSVQDAIDASKAGDTVTLLTDVTLNNGLVIPEGKDLILDLNNHKIEYCGTANDKSVVTNHGTLSISGGALDKTPGTLFNTSLTESYTLVISNYGTINTIGGNLLIKNNAAFGAAIWANAGTIHTIGGPGSYVELDVKNIGIYTTGGTIETIGGENGTVKITAAQYPVYTNLGSIGTIGGKNSNVTITSPGNWAIINVEKGSIGLIGGENASVKITKVGSDPAIYVRGGTIGTIGATGTGLVDIDSAGAGICVSGSGSKIEAIGGEGGKVDIDSTGRCVVVESSGRIDLIGGTNADVDVSANSQAVFVSSGSIDLIGGTNSVVTLKGDAAIEVSGGHIDLIGGENAQITMTSTGNNNVYIHDNGSIGTIAATGTGKIIINAANRGFLVFNTTAHTTDAEIELIGGNMEISANSGVFYMKAGNKIGTIGGTNCNMTIYSTCTTMKDNFVFIMGGGEIETIGGHNGNVTINSKNGGIYANSGSRIGTIGSTGTGLVTITGTNTVYVTGSGSKVDAIGGENGKIKIAATNNAVYVLDSGRVDLIGGTNAVVEISAIYSSATANYAALHVNAGWIEEVGGENANISLTLNNANSALRGMGVWVYFGGTINKLGSAGNLTITSNKTGVYVGEGNGTAATLNSIGCGGTVLITAETGLIVGSVGLGTVASNGGHVTITASGTGIEMGAKGQIATLGGENGTLCVNAAGFGVSMLAGSKITTLGAADSNVTIISKTYNVTVQGASIGNIGGERAKITFYNDGTSVNTVLLNIVSGGTVGTIGGKDAEIIMLQRGKNQNVQFGILMNGTNSKYSTITEIGAGAKFIEIVVDDCPIFMDSTCKISTISGNTYIVARVESVKSFSTHAIRNGGNIGAITGGYFCRGNALLNDVIPAGFQKLALFDANKVSVTLNADGTTYSFYTTHTHSYEDFQITWDGTNATATITCPACGEGTKNKTVAAEVVVTEDESKATAGDCKTPGTKTYVAVATYGELTATDTIVVEDKLGSHSYQAVVTDPTCTAQGYTTHTCTICDDSYVDSYVDATGHSYSEPVFTWNGYECTAKVTCTCGHEKNLDVEITSAVTTPATCVTKGVKTYTATTLWKDVTYTSSEHPTEELDIDSTNHIHTTNHEQQDATCTESGYTAGVFCEDCKQWISGHEEIQSNGHRYTETVTPPTCTDKGYTTHTCSVCGDTYTDNEVVATGHTPGESVKENDTAGSYDSVVYCTECGVELSRETIVTHTHTLTEVAAKAPTYTVAGNIAYYTCECGKYFSDAEGQNEIAEGSWILAALAAGTDAVLAIKPTSTNTPATLMLGAELKMSFNVDAKKTSAYDRIFLQITKRGVTTYVEIYSSTANNHSYRYTLAAPEMTVEMTVVVCGEKDGQIYVGDPITFTYKDIVVDKMDAFYNGTNEKNKVYGCALLANLLKYGEEAQKRFNINTDNLATSGLSETYLAMINTATPALDTWVAPGTADYYLRSYTPMLQEQIKIAMYFTVPDATSLEGYEVRIVRGDTGELINAVLQPYSDTRIRCDFALAGAYGRDNLAITLYKDGVAVSETVNTNLSALAQGKQSDTLNPLLYAMMNYCDAAKAFFG